MPELKLKGERATLKPYVGRIHRKFDFFNENELWNVADSYFVFDVESYVNYFLAAFRHIASGKIAYFESGEGLSFNPMRLARLVRNNTIIGFNSAAYDLSMIWLAYANQNPESLKELTNALIYEGKRPFEVQKQFHFQIFPSKHIDVMEVCPLRGSLKVYGARLHSPRIWELPFNHDQALSVDEIAICRNYCFNDLDNTQLIVGNLQEQLSLRADLGAEYGRDLMSKSDPQVAEAIIAAEIEKRTGRKPARPKVDVHAPAIHKYNVPAFMKFQTPLMRHVLNTIARAEYSMDGAYISIPHSVKELNVQIGNMQYTLGNGGLHSTEKQISHYSTSEYAIVDIDVISFYPRIILNQRLFPAKIGETFLQIYGTIYDRRVTAKKAKNFAVSEGLKIALNGTFGKLGSPYSILYDPQLVIQITVSGQLCLLMLIEAMEVNGISVISANTDGVTFRCPVGKRELMKALIKEWEAATEFQIEETEYLSYHARDVNNYIAVKKTPDESGKVKQKGAYLNPWNGGKKMAIFRFHKNPATTICIVAAERFITDRIPIEETIYASSDIREFVAVKAATHGAHKDGEYLGKVVRWYYARDVYGAINNIASGDMIPETDGAKPCMDLPDEFPTDVNYDWYIDRTKRILQELNVIKGPKQLSLFET